MPPKRRDRRESVEGSKAAVAVSNGNVQHTLAQPSDTDLFLQAFEKPTQIYRYLKTRNMISPSFLNRNLTYMKHRSTRTNKGRATFRIDSLLADKLKRCSDNERLGDYMTLMFLGYFDKSITDEEVVEVETCLSHISHKKRKDSSIAKHEKLGVSLVKVNPDDSNMCLSKIPAVSIATDSFKAVGNEQRKTFILQLNVTVSTNFSEQTNITNGIEEPSAKRPRSVACTNYESELAIFDKQSRCLLSEGEYELSLNERPIVQSKSNYSPKKHPTWQTDIQTVDKSAFDDFQGRPILKFRLAWTKDKCAPFVDRPLPITVKKHEPLMNGGSAMSTAETDHHQKDAAHNNNSELALPSGTGVNYFFIYNNNTRQQTEACENYHCPWCSLNCTNLYSLLKHLKLCHARFNFTYIETENDSRARVDVCINELYDGSYTGSPNDLVGPSNLAFSRAGPVRRTIVTRLLVCRPRRPKPSLAEFLEIDENEANNQRPYITGHNRLYHHTMTCLPVHPKELDIDSEGENDPAWLQHKTMMMIDDFTDVNEGEKELMKMWNLHIMKNGYVGDIQIPRACEMFIDLRGVELLKKNLYRNFVMHMCNLSDYGLVSPDVFYKIVQKLQRMLSAHEAERQIVADGRNGQIDYWLKVGQAKQKLKQLEEATKKSTASSADDKSRISLNRSDAESIQMTTLPKPEPALAGTTPVSTDKDDTKKEKSTSAKGRENNKPNKNGTAAAPAPAPISNKRRFSVLRSDSPPRRRSSGAPTLLQQQNVAASTNTTSAAAKPAPITRRRTSIGAISSAKSRKRTSLTLTK